jgi:hypothetical protein
MLLLYEAFTYYYMRPSDTRISDLQILVYKALKCCYMRPSDTTISDLQILVYKALRCCYMKPSDTTTSDLQILVYTALRCYYTSIRGLKILLQHQVVSELAECVTLLMRICPAQLVPHLYK